MPLIKADSVTVKLNGKTILNNISFIVNRGEQWVITGPSGSGKTSLLKVIAGKLHHTGSITINTNHLGLNRKVVLVEQQHHFKNLSNTSNFYYQQRFNSYDAEDAITVEEDVQQALSKSRIVQDEAKALVDLFDLRKLYTERLIQLSNGENKRLQIVKALLLQPAVLLLDSPFTGLDAGSRVMLENVLSKVAAKGIHIILTGTVSHLPHFITNILSLTSNSSYNVREKISLNQGEVVIESRLVDDKLLKDLTATEPKTSFHIAVKMKDVCIQYGGKKILDNINWEVRNGERWSLSGPNGSGKSTLLSLINADNPQAYANEIYLFDRKRGTGETIWDIKKKTGFVSPELHLYFEKGITCFQVVASGLFDTIGLFRKLTDRQSALVKKWMQLLQIENLHNKFLFQLSNSEQRLVLLARALIKNPPLLILDEPCQGLDVEQVHLFKNLVNEICLTGNKTLIYVSHYVEEVPECVTKFIRLQNGQRVDETG
jgi:molybdate transport system ATP-binding protein